MTNLFWLCRAIFLSCMAAAVVSQSAYGLTPEQEEVIAGSPLLRNYQNYNCEQLVAVLPAIESDANSPTAKPLVREGSGWHVLAIRQAQAKKNCQTGGNAGANSGAKIAPAASVAPPAQSPTASAETGKRLLPYLGVRYVPTEEGAYLNDPDGTRNTVFVGSPAANGGLKDKDLITKVNGESVSGNNSLSVIISRFSAGETVTITFIRDNKEQTTRVTLAERPD